MGKLHKSIKKDKIQSYDFQGGELTYDEAFRYGYRTGRADAYSETKPDTQEKKFWNKMSKSWKRTYEESKQKVKQ